MERENKGQKRSEKKYGKGEKGAEAEIYDTH